MLLPGTIHDKCVLYCFLHAYCGMNLTSSYAVGTRDPLFQKQERATPHTDRNVINPYPTAFPYGNGMVLHFYQQQESSATKTVHKVINKGLKAYV